MYKLSPCGENSPLFCYEDKAGQTRVLDYHGFNSALKEALRIAGLQTLDVTPHSFRRGGASFALMCGAPEVLIKAQGDWRSLAWEKYIDTPLTHRWTVADLLASKVQLVTP